MSYEGAGAVVVGSDGPLRTISSRWTYPCPYWRGGLLRLVWITYQVEISMEWTLGGRILGCWTEPPNYTHNNANGEGGMKQKRLAPPPSPSLPLPPWSRLGYLYQSKIQIGAEFFARSE